MKAISTFVGISVVFLFATTTKSFPANENSSIEPEKKSRVSDLEKGNSTSKETNPLKTSSISTTSSLLFKDTKPILTYLLGQPKKQGSVSSPAQLLSPDRYEFFTFDDDGQIVKKLMSVKEIQKIIANNEKGSASGQGNPIEYYQILTVTPDVESIPSVSRINPNEPLFSIHDVIASVQNVLKSEIKHSSSKINNTNFLAAASSDHFDILTEKPETPYTVEAPKVSSTVSVQTNPSSVLTTKKQESSVTEIIKLSTEKPDIQIVKDEPETKSSFEILLPAATEGIVGPAKTSIPPETKETKDSLTLGSSSSTPSPVALSVSSQGSTAATTPSTTATTTTTSKAPILNIESVPLSLADAHPALSSNESFLDVRPTSLEQISRISEPTFEELRVISPVNTTNENLERVETVNIDSEKALPKPELNQSNSESSTFSMQVPFTPDLAESVSSVLLQIASENSLPENSSLPAEATTVSSTAEKKVEKIETSESKHSLHSLYSLKPEAESILTTELPIQSKSTVRTEKLSENPLIILESILRPQNKPRPFEKNSLDEKQNLEQAESRTESSNSSPNAFEGLQYSPSSTVTIITESDHFPSSQSVPHPTTSKEQLNQTSNFVSSTTPIPPTFVLSLSPEVVDQSPEHLKPVTEKITAQLVNNTNTNSSQLTVEAVQVVQEGNIGNIPRTTEFPGQYVKDIQRMETEELASDTENLTDSPTLTITTQLPYVEQESSTAIETAEEKTEVLTENTEELTNQTVVAEKIESKIAEQNDEQTEKFGITFVPMLIKTPSEFKQEALLKSENQTEAKEETLVKTENQTEAKQEALIKIENQTEAKQEALLQTENQTEGQQEATTTDKTFESTETTEEIPTTETPQETVESKELPESNSQDELLQTITPTINIVNITTTENVIKSTAGLVVDDSVQDSDFAQIPALKQNIQTKPFFGKPQKPPFIKPLKTKPQTDSKVQKPNSPTKPLTKEPSKDSENKRPYENHLQSSPSVLELDATPAENLGLEATVVNLNDDVKRFAELCNELAFSLWSSVTHNGLSFVRSLVISPFAVTSLLAMVFLGARGPTSGQMNDILRLDDMVTFNPHLVFRNVTESLVISRNPGVATAAFVRELYSDKSKGKLLDFYKERVQQFYDGHVEEVNFKTIGETLRRQTNHLVKRQTWGKITDFLRGSNLMPRAPLAAFSANIFQTDCTKASIKDRDGEMYFVILPASRLRRLVPIPAVVYRDGFLAGYEPNLDATVVAINPSNSAISTILVLPGQQGLIAPGDTLARLEHHLLGSSYKTGHWSRLMRSLLPRPGLELQIPRLSHKSVINVTTSLQRMGLKDLFNADKADLTGLNGLANDLHLSDMLQVNLFSTCGEEPIGARHHSEIYPATPVLRREKSSENIFSDSIDNLFAISDFEDPAISALPLELRPRQARIPLSKPGARIPEPPRLRFDRPFLYFVRHNPTGLILHMGRFNPRLMP